MGSTITIVMYHFIRDLEHSRYQDIKSLRLDEFKEQLAYIQRHYNIVKMEDVMAAVESPGNFLPARPLLLTFDDGYLDHFTNVFPLLDEMGVQGSFFASGQAVLENKVLDVNKIHFILASVRDKGEIINSIFAMLDAYRGQYNLKSNRWYYDTFGKADRFDDKETIFIKRVLQKGLPKKVRREVIDKLFSSFVTDDEAGFSMELYMNLDQIRCLRRHGMFVGSHGYQHCWLNELEEKEKEIEVELSLEFLRKAGCELSEWAISYPYGGNDDSLLKTLKRKGCKVGLVDALAGQGIANLKTQHPLLLSRLDTNDLPKRANAQPNEWTRQVIEATKR